MYCNRHGRYAPFNRHPLLLDVPCQLLRWPPVHQEGMALLVLANGLGGLRTHDAINRTDTVAERAEPRLDVEDDGRASRAGTAFAEGGANPEFVLHKGAYPDFKPKKILAPTVSSVSGALRDATPLEKSVSGSSVPLIRWSTVVAKRLREGRTLEQGIAARPTADLDPEWADGFITPAQFVRMVYTSLAR